MFKAINDFFDKKFVFFFDIIKRIFVGYKTA